jgi:hypothetical protein
MSPEYYTFTLYAPDSSKESQKVYEQLASLCFEHLPSTHTLKSVNKDLIFTKKSGDQLALQHQGVVRELPSAIKDFAMRLNEKSGFRLVVEKAQ